MIHPYQSRTRNRDRSLAQRDADLGSPVAWISAGGFFIIFCCLVYPVFAHVLGLGR